MLPIGGPLWRRAGLDGVVTGIDLPACLALPSVAASGADPLALEIVLRAAELGAVDKWAELRREAEAESGDDKD